MFYFILGEVTSKRKHTSGCQRSGKCLQSPSKRKKSNKGVLDEFHDVNHMALPHCLIIEPDIVTTTDGDPPSDEDRNENVTNLASAEHGTKVEDVELPDVPDAIVNNTSVPNDEESAEKMPNLASGMANMAGDGEHATVSNINTNSPSDQSGNRTVTNVTEVSEIKAGDVESVDEAKVDVQPPSDKDRDEATNLPSEQASDLRSQIRTAISGPFKNFVKSDKDIDEKIVILENLLRGVPNQENETGDDKSDIGEVIEVKAEATVDDLINDISNTVESSGACELMTESKNNGGSVELGRASVKTEDVTASEVRLK